MHLSVNIQLAKLERIAKLTTLLLAALCFALPSGAAEIDFTRHLSHHSADSGSLNSRQMAFFGVAGSARLLVSSSDPALKATIALNGKTVIAASDFGANNPVEIAVTLNRDNSLAINLVEGTNGSLSVRIKQIADIELNVVSRMHFNANVSNFVAAREFFDKLGFKTLMGFPDTNTQAMARAIGIETPTSYNGAQGDYPGGYLLHGELIGINGFDGGLIDLIEFTIPRDESPPYAYVNHLGMARAAMYTTNIDADYVYMQGVGAQFIAAPTRRSDGTRFAIFADPDGVHYELIEIEGEIEETETTHITQLGQLNVNVSDFERSHAWYQMMGYEIDKKLPANESIEVGRAMGFEQAIEIDGAIMRHQADDSTLELVQWLSPYDAEQPYPIPVNHIGIHRTAFATTDIVADVAMLKAQGVRFVSPITPCCSGPDSSGSIVAFYDPDGTIVELVEQSAFIMTLLAGITWVMGLF